MKNIDISSVAVSLGGVETIVSYPIKMSHAAIPQNEREKLGIKSWRLYNKKHYGRQKNRTRGRYKNT